MIEDGNILDQAQECFGELVLHAYKEGMLSSGSGDVALFLASTMLVEFMNERLVRSGCSPLSISEAKTKAEGMARDIIEATKGRMYSKDTGEA
jgi:hypothetical protein